MIVTRQLARLAVATHTPRFDCLKINSWLDQQIFMLFRTSDGCGVVRYRSHFFL